MPSACAASFCVDEFEIKSIFYMQAFGTLLEF
jgi:hypothetical protein